MPLSQNDLMINFVFALCIIGIMYIVIMLVAIALMSPKQRKEKMHKKVDIIIKYQNDKRIYEKREKLTINKANQPKKEIYHIYKEIDKRNPKQNLLLERRVEIDDNKGHILRGNIERETVGSNSDNTSAEYIKQNIEEITRISTFDRKDRIIDSFTKKQTYGPLKMVKPLNYQIVKSQIIPITIPISMERNQIKFKTQEPVLGVETQTKEKNVLDVKLDSNTSLPMIVSSEVNEVSNLVAESESNVILDTVIANVRVIETKALVTNIDIIEMPTIESHIKIKEVPVYVSETKIKEIEGPLNEFDSVSTKVIKTEVPIFVEKAITIEMTPALVPVSLQTTKILKEFML